MKYSKAFFLLLALSLCFSCNRDDDDNTDQPTPIGRIFGQVMHHEDLIPDALVYIKYDATEFPGIDPSNYDDQVTVDSIDASFEFTNLGKGSYYLFGIGNDEACFCEVIGGIPVALISDEATFETIVPVTE
ncbi:MAG: hypothetical protein ACI8YQ_000320 [Polaribacter sp.]|jgi:hypothetical protein